MDSIKTTQILDKILEVSLWQELAGELYARYLQYTPLFFIAFLAAIFLTPVVGKLATNFQILNETRSFRRNGLNRFDNINRRINPNAVPLLGGLAILIPLLLIIYTLFQPSSMLIAFTIGILILIISGVLDDIYNLPGSIQFLFQFIAASCIAVSVANLTVLKVPFDGLLDLEWYRYHTNQLPFLIDLVFPGDLIMVLWIMVCINAVKWVAGMDALMESNLLIAFILLFIIGVRVELIFVTAVSIFMAGGLLGFTIFNFPPAKIFSGSVGKSTYGFIVATLSILNEAKVATTVLILLLPLVDFGFVLLKRLTLYKPKTLRELILAPIELMRMSDTNHIHHQLMKLNFSVKQILATELTISLLAGSVAVLTAEAYKLFFILIIGSAIGLIIFALHVLANRRQIVIQEKKAQETPESKYSY